MTATRVLTDADELAGYAASLDERLQAGARAQQAFWGGEAPEASMLHQFATAT